MLNTEVAVVLAVSLKT
jgi:hypothetical protein